MAVVTEASGSREGASTDRPTMPMPTLDPRELNKLAEFAEMGGLGVADALVDVVAEQPDQLMFLTHDKLVILRDLGSVLVASCEGVVGWVRRADVRFDAPLSLGDPQAVLVSSPSKGSLASTSSSSLPRLASQRLLADPLAIDKDDEDDQNQKTSKLESPNGGFKTVVVSPSPPQHQALLPEDPAPPAGEEAAVDEGTGEPPLSASTYTTTGSNGYAHSAGQGYSSGAHTPDSLAPSPSHPSPLDLQRISNQFDLESPLNTPGSSQLGSGSGFVDTRADMPGAFPGAFTPDVDVGRASAGELGMDERLHKLELGDGARAGTDRDSERANEVDGAGGGADGVRALRESMASVRSDISSALGGIGGLLMGGNESTMGHGEDEERREELKRIMSGTPSPPLAYSLDSPAAPGMPGAVYGSTFAAAQAAAMALNANHAPFTSTHSGRHDTVPPSDLASGSPSLASPPMPPAPMSPLSPAYASSVHSARSAHSVQSGVSQASVQTGSSWDVYETYSRESMYVKPGSVQLQLPKTSDPPPPAIPQPLPQTALYAHAQSPQAQQQQQEQLLALHLPLNRNRKRGGMVPPPSAFLLDTEAAPGIKDDEAEEVTAQTRGLVPLEQTPIEAESVRGGPAFQMTVRRGSADEQDEHEEQDELRTSTAEADVEAEVDMDRFITPSSSLSAFPPALPAETETDLAPPVPGGRKRSIASQIFLSTNAQASPEKDQGSGRTLEPSAGRGANRDRRSDIMSFASIFSDNSFDDDGRAFAGARLALERVGKIREQVPEEDEAEGEEEIGGEEEDERRTRVGDANMILGALGAPLPPPPPRPPRRQTAEEGDVQSDEDTGERQMTLPNGQRRREVSAETVALRNISPAVRSSGNSTPSASTAPGAPVVSPPDSAGLPPASDAASGQEPRGTMSGFTPSHMHKASTGTSASVEGTLARLETAIGPLMLANPDEGSQTGSPVEVPSSIPRAAVRPDVEAQVRSPLAPLSMASAYEHVASTTPSAATSYADHSFDPSEADTPVSCKILTPHGGSEAQDHVHAHGHGHSRSASPGIMTPLPMSRDPSSLGHMPVGGPGADETLGAGPGKGEAILGSPFPVTSRNGTPILGAPPPRQASAASITPLSAVPSNLDQRRPSADRGLSPLPLDGAGRSPLPSPNSATGAGAGAFAVATPPLGHAQWTPTLNSASPVTGAGSNTGSPHSVTATRQAVELGRNTPPVTRGQRSATLTLVGSTTMDLAASRGPVPITFTVGDPAQAHIMREGARLREAATANGGGGGGGIGIGLGLPSSLGSNGRISPSGASRPGSPSVPHSPFAEDPYRRPSSPLVASAANSRHSPRDIAVGMGLAAPFMEDTATALKSAPSPYPQMHMQSRSATLPLQGNRASPAQIQLPGSPVIGDFGNLRYPSPASAAAGANGGSGGPATVGHTGNVNGRPKMGGISAQGNIPMGPAKQASGPQAVLKEQAQAARNRMGAPHGHTSSGSASAAAGTPQKIAPGSGQATPPPATAAADSAADPQGKGKGGIFQRQRSRSFSAAMNKALGRKSGSNGNEAPALPPAMPSAANPAAVPAPSKNESSTSGPVSQATNATGNGNLGQRPNFARQASLPNAAAQAASTTSASARAAPPPPVNTINTSQPPRIDTMLSPTAAAPPRSSQSTVRSATSPVQSTPTTADFASFSAQRKGSTPTVIIPDSDRSESPASTSPPPARPESPSVVGLHPHTAHSAQGTPSSVRTASGIGAFGFRRPSGAKGSKTSIGSNGPQTPTGRHSPLPMPSPVSHKDFIHEEAKDTIKEDGVAFEMVQPKRSAPPSSDNGAASPKSSYLSSPDKLGAGLGGTFNPSATSLDTLSVLGSGSAFHGYEDELERKKTINTIKSSQSGRSGTSARTLPETDEWGFVLSMGTTPEIYLGRAEGGAQRENEMKWLGIINSPLSGPPAKRIRKLALENGIPASLRGRVWAWFMAGHMSARRPGLYHELLDHWKGKEELGQQIDDDVDSAYPDHSIYSGTSTGQSDLRAILRAYSNFATGGYRSEMALVAGMLLIHCVAEDAFWLFAGFVNGVLRDYYAAPSKSPFANGHPPSALDGPTSKKALQLGRDGVSIGMKVDSGVFERVLYGSEPRVGKLFKELGVQSILFLSRWWPRLYLRCLPWPTALRVIDAVIAEGPRFLIITALAILTVSKERLLGLPRNAQAIIDYLNNLPQDALLLPDSFMKACDNVKFREDDYRKLRGAVEKDVLAATSV